VRRFRADLAGTLRRVVAGGEYVVLTRRGAPVAAIIPPGALALLDAADDRSPGRSLKVTCVPVRYGFRPNLAEVLRRIVADGAQVVLTRHGVPVAAVVAAIVLDQIDVADRLLAQRANEAREDLDDLEAAALDVAPRKDSVMASPRRSGRPAVPRRE